MFQRCLQCLFKVFVLPEFDDWDVMYSGMLYIWWNTVLINVLRSSGSSLCDFIHPLHSPLPCGKPQTLSWPGPSKNGWSYPSVTGAQLHTTVLHFGTQCGAWGITRVQGHISRWALLSAKHKTVYRSTTIHHLPPLQRRWRCQTTSPAGDASSCERPAGIVKNFVYWTLLYWNIVYVLCNCPLCLTLCEWVKDEASESCFATVLQLTYNLWWLT